MNERDWRRLAKVTERFYSEVERSDNSVGLPAWVRPRMSAAGFDLQDVIVLDWYPDDTNVYFVYLVTSSESAFYLHVGKDEAFPVEVEDATEDFRNVLEANKQRPWVREWLVRRYLAERRSAL